MEKPYFLENYSNSPKLSNLKGILNVYGSHIQIKGLIGSAKSFLISELYKTYSIVWILENEEKAKYHLLDLEHIVNKNNVFYFPDPGNSIFEEEDIDNGHILLRTAVFNQLSKKNKQLIVTYPDALLEKVSTLKQLAKNTFKINKNQKLSIDFLRDLLLEYAFRFVDFTNVPGEFSIRGGIIDVFSYANDKPYRIEFCDDIIESIRIFDPIKQLSVATVDDFVLSPNVNQLIHKTKEPFFNLLDDSFLIVYDRLDYLKSIINLSLEKKEKQITEKGNDFSKIKHLYCDFNSLFETFQNKKKITLDPSEKPDIIFNQTPQPTINKQFDVLFSSLNEHSKLGIKNYIACASSQQEERLKEIFRLSKQSFNYKTIPFSLFNGFIDKEHKIAVYTDHQIFNRYHKAITTPRFSKNQSLTLEELTQIRQGDYVVHVEHGIGVFEGLKNIDQFGKTQEVIKLSYDDYDTLYVNIHSLHKITKYNSKNDIKPKINKLGSKIWKIKKQRIKSKIKEIAFNLIKVYATRRHAKGFAFLPDTYLQHELEASFIYEDTPDQLKATREIKADMESPHPMDRLICGDVGFGKTELAIRAAFKAVDNNKQVALLVPTTILAFQHYKTFTKRLRDFPVEIAYINRFTNSLEKKRIIQETNNGKINILIGTHSILRDNLFSDLGLLIVDEEQKFGVSDKEKLKQLKSHIDILSLSATPIPRTLQFSLMQARDLSIIKSPPPNRHPIESTVVNFNKGIIRDAILFELNRGGQVYFVHNRIQDIKEMGNLIQRLIPQAKIAIGHGQKRGKEMESIFLDFIDKNYDVFLSTSIIENGLDVSNANTMLINNAHLFGLSDLHQLRGRIGRSSQKAFCYFMVPSRSIMTEESRKRMDTISQYTEIGSGIEIAMKDLEIRGAGDLLGGNQSGFINEIGFETYQKILDEAIEEVKHSEEFDNLYEEVDRRYVTDVQIEADIALLFPKDYINNTNERLSLYKQLNTLKNYDEIMQFKSVLKDRFGSPPKEAIQLIDSIQIKWLAAKLGLQKVVLKNKSITAFFISDEKNRFFNSPVFPHIIQKIHASSKKYSLSQKQSSTNKRLIMKVNNVYSISNVIEALAYFTKD